MELVILIGLQAAGKSTFYRTRFAETYEHISKDRLLNNRHPARRQAQLIAEALEAGRSVVVDNTNATVAERAELIQAGRAYGAMIIGYSFEVQVKVSLARNKQREGKARVPDIAIFATLKRLAPPSYAEGFDTLYSVCATGDDTFEVRPWPRGQSGDQEEAGGPPQHVLTDPCQSLAVEEEEA
ncbi:MAG: ATP-binding protein [Ktedonobacteraceae bacterium]|nr:ATP-binding protein [Ktedonobacteraceae bacterium]